MCKNGVWCSWSQGLCLCAYTVMSRFYLINTCEKWSPLKWMPIVPYTSRYSKCVWVLYKQAIECLVLTFGTHLKTRTKRRKKKSTVENDFIQTYKSVFMYFSFYADSFAWALDLTRLFMLYVRLQCRVAHPIHSTHSVCIHTHTPLIPTDLWIQIVVGVTHEPELFRCARKIWLYPP